MGMPLTKKQAALKTGQRGENIAAAFLLKIGYKILQRNFKNDYGRRLGEIDIIALKESTLVFVEVKTVVESAYYQSLPEQMITSEKIRKLNKIAQLYVKKEKLWDTPSRFDAVSVTIKPETSTAAIRHLKNIFI